MGFETVDEPERWIVGVATRTCNADEMRPDRARLPRLWQRAARTGPADAEMVAVLTDYESDHGGEYTQIVGRSVPGPPQLDEGLVAVRIPAGRYARIVAEGELPGAIVEAWQQVWAAQETGALRRSFRTDFEIWPASHAPAIHLSIER